jgi:hypothetical protein
MKDNRSLTADERDDLLELTADLRALRKRWRKLVAGLQRARRSSVRGEVRDRLLCVLHDCLAPALRDLRSIEAAAREPSRTHSPKRRRADAERAVPGHSG